MPACWSCLQAAKEARARRQAEVAQRLQPSAELASLIAREVPTPEAEGDAAGAGEGAVSAKLAKRQAAQQVRRAATYDAFGLIGATFRQLDWKTLTFFERVAPISPNAW
jgi:hypothetical protein